MALYLITKLLWITYFAIVSYAFPITDSNGAALYLMKFGYLEESPSAILDQNTISSAITDFQEFANLNVTGQLNAETIAKMNVPRCGVKDKFRPSDRKRRYILEGNKWSKNELTYRINKYPSRFRNYRIIKNEIARAFKIWGDVTPLIFRRKVAGPADIDIRFEVGNHGDRLFFDGPGKTLAHAFPPPNADAHFDDQEIWTISERFGKNLFQIAAHEFGHSLGLSHSTEMRAVMAPFDSTYNPEFQLHPDDIAGIQALYGRIPPNRSSGIINVSHNLCQDAKIDAITRTQSGRTYMFKGKYYWKILSNGIAAGYPRNISDDWNGLAGNFDAAVTAGGKTFFFKGTQYWRFTNKLMDRGYPKLISQGFPGIPNNLNAALAWTTNGETFFFKGDKYWQYDWDSNPRVSPDYPQPVREWSSLLPNGIDAAIKWDDKRTYFFKDDQYYRYNDETAAVVNGYPRSTATEWFYC